MVLAAIAAGLTTWFFMYLDARLFDTPKSKLTYVKGITFVSGLVAFIVHFLYDGQVVQSGGGSPMYGTTMIPLAGGAEEVLTGLPTF